MKKALFVLALALPSAVDAQLSRAAVSINGLDTNPCTVPAPCRSFSAAVSQTNAGGEVIAIDSGGYGPFTVDRPLTVMGAPGVYAGITAFSGDGISVAPGTGATVVLRNLYLNGGGSGNAGVAFTSGNASQLHVENVFIQGFSYGVYTYLPVRIDDTKLLNCSTGVYIDNAGAAVWLTLNRVTIKGLGSSTLGFGVVIWRNATVVMRDSVVMRALVGVALMSGATGAVVENTMIVQSGFGIDAGGGFARISNCMIADNDYGVSVETGISVESWQNNRIRGNHVTDIQQVGSGTFTTIAAN